MFQATLMEAGQGRIGAPPWKDAAAYLRNSPLFYADRIETPLLIVQGDMDYVAIQQGEELFSALYRQGSGQARPLRALLGRGSRAREPAEHPRHVAARVRLVRRVPGRMTAMRSAAAQRLQKAASERAARSWRQWA